LGIDRLFALFEKPIFPRPVQDHDLGQIDFR
jgi:hypothetical protein